MTLAALKACIDEADGDLRLRVPPLRRVPGSLRLVVRAKLPNVPESWAMSLLLDNVIIDCVHHHTTEYTNTNGRKAVGWHRDLLTAGQNIGRQTLDKFSPKKLDEFLVLALDLFRLTLKEGREDAHGQLPIN